MCGGRHLKAFLVELQRLLGVLQYVVLLAELGGAHGKVGEEDDLGGLALLVITVWLAHKKISMIYTGIPMVFMVSMTAWVMKINLVDFYANGEWLLFSIGSIIMLLQAWMVAEGMIVLARLRRN